jgi:hypothetical protein
MPSITEEVAAGVAQALAPIADHVVNSLVKAINEEKEDVLKRLSGKEFVFTLKIPDLTNG